MDKVSDIPLTRGKIRTYNFEKIKLHIYENNDFTEKINVILEKNGEAIIIDTPIFVDNIRELEKYITTRNLKIVGKILSCHAGASFLPHVPVYTTRKSYNFSVNGEGRKILDEHVMLFGDEVDADAGKNIVFLNEGEEIEIAGIEMRIIKGGEMFDIEIPEMKAVHTHTLCHNSHSVMFNPKSAKSLAGRLTKYLEAGYEVFMSSHHSFEGPEKVRESIAYFNSLSELSSKYEDVASFMRAVRNRFPSYDGDYYLGITAKMFMSKKHRHHLL
ncbi:MAG: MBL fold metallo-hydrolase [Candidatus Nomurabacteria bacterium]|jgi:hypothetical protein|nr:MBL fold metallo-hydrolase [Candidatus Nomurabacteria bacterium]